MTENQKIRPAMRPMARDRHPAIFQKSCPNRWPVGKIVFLRRFFSRIGPDRGRNSTSEARSAGKTRFAAFPCLSGPCRALLALFWNYSLAPADFLFLALAGPISGHAHLSPPLLHQFLFLLPLLHSVGGPALARPWPGPLPEILEIVRKFKNIDPHLVLDHGVISESALALLEKIGLSRIQSARTLVLLIYLIKTEPTGWINFAFPGLWLEIVIRRFSRNRAQIVGLPKKTTQTCVFKNRP